jgi:hypothetical protein
MQRRPLISLTLSAVRGASALACFIVVLWFTIFAAGEAGSASARQADSLAVPTPTSAEAVDGAGLNEAAAATQGAANAAPGQPLKKAIVHAGDKIAGPFENITGSSSPWIQRGLATVLVLMLYGLGVSFVLRAILLRR